MHHFSQKILLMLIGLLALEVMGQETILKKDLNYFLPAQTDYDPKIPTPEFFFGFQIGERHLRHDQLVEYMETLAKISDRVNIQEYGRTYEQRRLVLLTISSPENIRNIDQIQKDHLALSNPDAKRLSIHDDMPVVVWLGYSVHGNEASGCNASALVAYYLAAADNSEIMEMLKKMIVLIDPCVNPDGMDRFANWVNIHRSKVPITDPFHREHTPMWPSARTNHYWFDLNRDWVLAQHPETQSRLVMFHQWKPNILTDHHEMGGNATFFFQPGVPSRNHPMIPKKTVELAAEIAQYHARALDQIGSLYFSKEQFDDFNFGKGSTYPDVNGTIGILFEQASSRGHVQEKRDGGVLTFAFAIRNQVTVSFSTLQAATAMRLKLLNYQANFYLNAIQESKKSAVKAYVFGSALDPVRNYLLLNILHQNQIASHKLAQPIKIGSEDFNPGHSYIVPTSQAQYRLLTALFEKRTSFQDSLFYDISSWTIPLAAGVPFAEYKGNIPLQKLLGDKTENVIFPRGEWHEMNNAVAYVIEWNQYYAPRALYRILDSDIPVKFAIQPFQIDIQGRIKEFGYGSIMIPLLEGKRKKDIESLLQTCINEDGLRIYTVGSGAIRGVDLGSSRFVSVKKPKILFAMDRTTSSGQVGEAWHLLDQRFSMPVSIVETRFLNDVPLDKYTVIVFFDGKYTSIDDTTIATLKIWHKRGGTLIGLQRGAKWLVDKKFAAAAFVKPPRDSVFVDKPYAGIEYEKGAQSIGGAIILAKIDPTHPLCYGYDRNSIHLFHRNSSKLFMKPAKNPYATPVQYTDKPLVSGYISDKNLDLIKNSASVIVSGLNSGRSILMMDNPNFRAFWYGTNKLFMNAIFWGSTIRSDTISKPEKPKNSGKKEQK